MVWGAEINEQRKLLVVSDAKYTCENMYAFSIFCRTLTLFKSYVSMFRRNASSLVYTFLDLLLSFLSYLHL